MSTEDLPLHVQRLGSGGPHLVLVHGFAANNSTWRHWIDDLARDYRLVLVELKGHGSAPAPLDGRYAPDDYADLIVRLVKSLDSDSDLVLCGHSMGGGVCLLATVRLMAEAPGRLRALVMVAGAAYPQPLPPFVRLARLRFMARALFWLIPKRWLLRKVLRAIVFDPGTVSREMVESYAAPLRNRPNRVAVLETASRIVPDDLDAKIRSFHAVDVPILALWGRQDPVVPLRTGERLARELSNVRLEIIEECGHIPPEEHPERSLGIVRGFLEDVAAHAP